MKLFNLFTAIVFVSCLTGCDQIATSQSASGVNQASVSVPTGADGVTVEQRNVRDRLLMDNKIGSIKHLYVISAYSGQCLIYSTVRGKVTSSGKRLHPSTTTYTSSSTFTDHYSPELLGDDGTYGTSVEYIYWWDTKGIYHQHYIQGGQIVHISDQPMPVKSVTINMEMAESSAA